MECLKELLLLKYFSPFGYIIAVLYLPILVGFVSYSGNLRNTEREKFSCPSSPDSRDDCLVKYDKEYNSPLPLWGFVLLCFIPPFLVCIAYSWCFVKSRVDKLEAALKANPQNPQPRRRVTTRRVFYSYSLHLLVRVVLGILFILLQNFVFYPDGFPTEFACVSPTPSKPASVLKPTVTNNISSSLNSSAINIINCDNSVGSDSAICAMGILIANGLFVFFVFGELCYLLLLVGQRKEFTFDSEFYLKHFLNKSGTPIVLQDITLEMKEGNLRETENIEVFVDLVIYVGRSEPKFVDLSRRHEIFDIYLKPQHDLAVPIKKLEDLFLPNKDTQDPRKILVVGRAGIGKSLLCTKLKRDWSNGDLLSDSNKSFEQMFVFRCRWFNNEADSSLKELISPQYPNGSINNDIFQYLLDNPGKLLLVFDGLDEFKHHESCLKDEEAQFGNGPTDAMPFAALYVKLVKGKQLPGATVVTTCRPNVLQSVEGPKFDRQVEIMGFTPEKVEEYVAKFCAHDTERASRMWGHISSNLELLSLCYIPANSSIVCSLLENLIKLQDQDSGSSTLRTTSTEIYKGALRFFIYKHHPEYRGKPLTKDYLEEDVNFTDSVERTLSQVGTLAKTGIEKRQLVFDSKEMHGLQDCGLFNQMQDKEVSNLQYKPQYCFIHLTLQEFLAAREIAKMDPSNLSDFISTHASDPEWHMVIQFVAGLLCGQENEAVNIFVGLLCDLLTEEPRFEDRETKQNILLLVKCLYENNNETVVERAASELQENSKFDNRIDLSVCQVTLIDCAAIAFFIQHLHELTELNLCCNNITAQGVSRLCDALKDVNCRLTILNLGFNNITDQGVSHLCELLKHVNCKLNELILSANEITDEGVLHLCDALKNKNCKVTELNISYNNITDKSVSELSDALKHEDCRLTELNLRYIFVEKCLSPPCDTLKMVKKGVSHLSDALKNVNCKLTRLNLDCNNITDQVLSHLCDALNNVNCKLTELSLAENKVTDQGVSQLCDALTDVTCKLTALNLSKNNITDQGVLYLCRALKGVNCKLTELKIKNLNNITDEGVSHLCHALTDKNCKLTALNLGENGITDQGASELCNALKNENCKLVSLNLSNNNITDQSVPDLIEVLSKVKYAVLNFLCNKITDQGISRLSESLKDKKFKIYLLLN